MANENPTGGRCDFAVLPSEEEQDDWRMQDLVLGHVLVEWPTHLRVEDLIRELPNEGCGFADRDSVERAVSDLFAAGLLFCCGVAIVPTKAAVHFNLIRTEDQ